MTKLFRQGFRRHGFAFFCVDSNVQRGGYHFGRFILSHGEICRVWNDISFQHVGVIGFVDVQPCA